MHSCIIRVLSVLPNQFDTLHFLECVSTHVDTLHSETITPLETRTLQYEVLYNLVEYLWTMGRFCSGVT